MTAYFQGEGIRGVSPTSIIVSNYANSPKKNETKIDSIKIPAENKVD